MITGLWGCGKEHETGVNQRGRICVCPVMRSFVRSAGSHRLVRSLRLVVPLLLLVALVVNLGTDPFARSLHVLTPGPIVAAMLLGVITTAAQALRWRTVAIGYDAAEGLTRSRA